jgi:hypothetical protein
VNVSAPTQPAAGLRISFSLRSAEHQAQARAHILNSAQQSMHLPFYSLDDRARGILTLSMALLLLRQSQHQEHLHSYNNCFTVGSLVNMPTDGMSRSSSAHHLPETVRTNNAARPPTDCRGTLKSSFHRRNPHCRTLPLLGQTQLYTASMRAAAIH